jgi:carboxymethylenebutenolidase
MPMMSRVTIVAVMATMLCLCGVAGAQDWAKATLNKSPRHGEYVTITEPSGRKLQAWVVYPEVKDKAPVVVMIHEIFGQSDWAREMADEVASAGYIVVEPDLLSGFGPVGATPMLGPRCDPMNCPSAQQAPAKASSPVPVDHSHMQMQPGTGAAFGPASPGGTAAFPDQSAVVKAVSSLDLNLVMADLDAAADYGKKLPAASGKLYVAGFCWGGTQTFSFATHRKDLSASFVFYGTPPPADTMKNITAPVYGFYAGDDARVTSTVAQTTLDMKAAGKTYDPVTYDGAGHGFMRAGEPPEANAENSAARADGFRRLVTLLGGVR